MACAGAVTFRRDFQANARILSFQAKKWHDAAYHFILSVGDGVRVLTDQSRFCCVGSTTTWQTPEGTYARPIQLAFLARR